MNGTQTWRDKPREQGKAAYREGKSLDANPYPADSGNSLSWAEGWIWSKVHFPQPKYRVACSCNDPQTSRFSAQLN